MKNSKKNKILKKIANLHGYPKQSLVMLISSCIFLIKMTST